MKAHRLYTDSRLEVIEAEFGGSVRPFRVEWTWRAAWVKKLQTLVWLADLHCLELGTTGLPIPRQMRWSDAEVCVEQAIYAELPESVAAEYFEDHSKAVQRAIALAEECAQRFDGAVARIRADPDNLIPKQLAAVAKARRHLQAAPPPLPEDWVAKVHRRLQAGPPPLPED